MMLSSNQYYKQYPSSNFDDLFTFPVDIVFDEEFNQFANSNDDDAMILSELDLSSDSNQYQSSPESPIAEMICGVCGAPATGYNFDQITCESCKAFFRRNALRNTADLKCRFSGSCVINIHTRRQCTYCRLKKCFDIKMRKEWIRTEEEVKLRQIQKQIKQERKLHRDKIDPKPVVVLPIVVRKKKRLLRKSLSIVQPVHNGIFFGLHRNLEESDNVWLNNITHAYQFGADKADCTFIAHYTEEATLSQFMRDESSVITSLIYFYKGVPEFKRLDIDDQVQLIKLNIRNIIHIHRVIIENFEDSPHIAKHMSKWIGPVFHQQMSRTRQRFYRFVKYPLLLKLSLIVFLFSVNSSTTRDTTECENYQNLDKVIEYQDFYTALLWRYLNYLFEEKEAIESMEIIVTQILRYQILMMTMVDHAREISKQDGLHELMETIFGLSRQANVHENRTLPGKSN